MVSLQYYGYRQTISRLMDSPSHLDCKNITTSFKNWDYVNWNSLISEGVYETLSHVQAFKLVSRLISLFYNHGLIVSASVLKFYLCFTKQS